MIISKTRKWGNSIGVIIPKEELSKMNIKENQDVVLEIRKKDNPLKELFGFGKNNPITKEEFIKTRAMMESRIK